MAKAKADTEEKEKKPRKPKAETAAKSGARKTGARKKAAAPPEAVEPEQAAETPAATAPAEAAPPENATLDGVSLPATSGKVAIFGGPKDRGIKPDDKLKLPTGPYFVYERVRSLNPKSFYCAMRWSYSIAHKSPEEAKRWWANKKLLITNPKNGNAVVARAVDHGPHENTGLDIGLSPGAAEALGVETGDEVAIAFANQKAPLGPVQEG
ncbi:MAG TPA: hypothetical protein VNO70_05600 [Blastocatellia bacterium]|nr:hypothetical protein [Blastocatellia bacterium]